MMGFTYWFVVTIVALIHIGFGALLMVLWQDRRELLYGVVDDVVEYVYFDDNAQVMYSASHNPLKYEDQTLSIALRFDCERSRDILLNNLFPNGFGEYVKVPLMYHDDEEGKRIYDWDGMSDYYHAELDVIQTQNGDLQ
jgi:hypothetical protein